MTITCEEIFDPVLSIIGYRDGADAVTTANDTAYGLAGYVWSGNVQRAQGCAAAESWERQPQRCSQRSRWPFGGYKQSGNGREWGRFGLEEFLEVKAIAGFSAA
jgi:aldehyde dehydrogenase (NAD+)